MKKVLCVRSCRVVTVSSNRTSTPSTANCDPQHDKQSPPRHLLSPWRASATAVAARNSLHTLFSRHFALNSGDPQTSSSLMLRTVHECHTAPSRMSSLEPILCFNPRHGRSLHGGPPEFQLVSFSSDNDHPFPACLDPLQGRRLVGHSCISHPLRSRPPDLQRTRLLIDMARTHNEQCVEQASPPGFGDNMPDRRSTCAPIERLPEGLAPFFPNRP